MINFIVFKTDMSLKYCLLFVLVSVMVNDVVAQPSVSAANLPEVQVKGAGLMPLETTPSLSDKVQTYYTAGGFVHIHIREKNDHLTYRAYFNPDQTTESVFSAARPAGEIYLKVNDTYRLDLLDKTTDSLVKRYVIRRVKVIPELRITHYTGNKHSVSISPASQSGRIRIQPDELMDIVAGKSPGFGNAVIEFTISNLKTGKTEYRIGTQGLKALKFAANTDYALHFHYTIQPESTSVLFISVAPYWYQSVVTYFVIVIALVLLCMVLLVANTKRKLRISKNKHEKLKQAALRLQSQLNPHFTFNALSSIQGLMNTGRIVEANDYLQEFSSLLRKTLMKSQHIYNSLDQELDMMRTYIRLEALRFNFIWDIQVSDSLHPAEIEVPILLIQPLIENAIRHGLAGAGDKGRLQLICEETEKKDTFILIIKDNGEWKEPVQDRGYGLSLTAERIRAINKLHQDRSIRMVFNRQSGTEIVLIFHHWLSAE